MRKDNVLNTILVSITAVGFVTDAIICLKAYSLDKGYGSIKDFLKR